MQDSNSGACQSTTLQPGGVFYRTAGSYKHLARLPPKPQPTLNPAPSPLR